jgi:hypothetical protein
MTTTQKHYYHHHSTESKYKGGAHDKFVIYDLEQRTRGDNMAIYPKVRRVFISGNIKKWELGHFRKNSGHEVYGVRIIYEQICKVYRRVGFEAKRGQTEDSVNSAETPPSSQEFTQIVEVPEEATNVHFYADKNELPEKYQTVIQDVRSRLHKNII